MLELGRSLVIPDNPRTSHQICECVQNLVRIHEDSVVLLTPTAHSRARSLRDTRVGRLQGVAEFGAFAARAQAALLREDNAGLASLLRSAIGPMSSVLDATDVADAALACEFLAWATSEKVGEVKVPGLDEIRADVWALESWTRESIGRFDVLESGVPNVERLPDYILDALDATRRTGKRGKRVERARKVEHLPEDVVRRLRQALERFRDELPTPVSGPPQVNGKAWRKALLAFQKFYSEKSGLMKHPALTVQIDTRAYISVPRPAALVIATLTTQENMVFAAEAAAFGLGDWPRADCEVQLNIEKGVWGRDNPFGSGVIRTRVGGENVWPEIRSSAVESTPPAFVDGLARLAERPEARKLFVLINHVTNGQLQYSGVERSGEDTGADFRKGVKKHAERPGSIILGLGITCAAGKFIDSWGLLPVGTLFLAFSNGGSTIRNLCASNLGREDYFAAADGVGVVRVLDRLLAADPKVLLEDVPRLVRRRFQVVLIDPHKLAPGLRLIEFYRPSIESVRLLEVDELPPTPASQAIVEDGKLSTKAPPLRSRTSVGGDDASFRRALLEFGRPLDPPKYEVRSDIDRRLTLPEGVA
jgi:hypothetical protein